ncbi:MAG TPA: NADH-quinone oxidoreductase subunit J [Pirellulales bacterium]
MTQTQSVMLVATLLAAVGLWLLLPRGEGWGRKLGILLALASLGLFASRLPRLGSTSAEVIFWFLAAVTVMSAVCAVTLKSPVYCAIWFAMTLLGTSGLFLFQGAQFLGVATIVVYAGAILVTFLFVLMLAQPEGHAYYDRVSWEALVSACVGAVMIGILTMVIGDAFAPKSFTVDETEKYVTLTDGIVDPIAGREVPQRTDEILSDRHMDHLGTQLFSRHLIAVEVAGTMLLAALVGAVSIAIQSKPLARSAGGARHG